MYGIGAGIMGGVLLGNLLNSAFGMFVSIVCSIVFGILGNYIYMQQTEKKIQTYHSLQDEVLKQNYVTQNSGVNLGAVFGAIGIIIVISIFIAAAR